jgi:hypothetical protein
VFEVSWSVDHISFLISVIAATAPAAQCIVFQAEPAVLTHARGGCPAVSACDLTPAPTDMLESAAVRTTPHLGEHISENYNTRY